MFMMGCAVPSEDILAICALSGELQSTCSLTQPERETIHLSSGWGGVGGIEGSRVSRKLGGNLCDLRQFTDTIVHGSSHHFVLQSFVLLL